jgi:hypothetical protein
MPLHPSQYGREIKAKLEAEAVAANCAVARARGLNERLEKRAAEIEAEDDLPVVDKYDASTDAQIKSPAFPTIAEALQRRQRAREHLAVRMMFAAAIVALAYSLIFGGAVGYTAAGFFLTGSLIGYAAVRSRRHG